MMNGRELGFILQKSGLTYAKFAESIGKRSVSTVQRWVSYDAEVKGIYILMLERIITKGLYQELRSEWKRLHPPRA
ncbi:MAG: hypothetical protein IPM69_13690 [Ignavibacteria bacterium]|nr:hypothetical protein [Ignavibacteria bacterium]